MRRGLAVAVAVLLVDGGLIAFVAALVVAVGQLVTVLPEYSEDWDDLVSGVRDTLQGWGVGADQVDSALHALDPATLAAALGDVLLSIAGTAGALFLVVATVVFMTAEATGVAERLAQVPGTAHLHEALVAFAHNTRRYMVVTAAFGLAVAVVDTIALVVLGVPLALLWGLLSFLTNFVPNIGFFLGLVPPTLLALLTGGPGTALLVVLVYCVANFLLQSVLQPVVVGDAVGLSITVSFLSVFVWTIVMGPVGAILAIPLTLFVYAVLVGQDPARRWAATLLAGASGAEHADRPPRARGWRRGATAPAPAATDSEPPPQADGSRSATAAG